MELSDGVTRIPFPPIPAPVRVAMAVVLCLVLSVVNGLTLALMDMLQSTLRTLALLSQSDRDWRTMAGIAGRGVVLTLQAAPPPIWSNLVVGVRAGVEMGRHLDSAEDQSFELIIGGGADVSFSARSGHLLTTGVVVKPGLHRSYPLIESFYSSYTQPPPQPQAQPTPVARRSTPTTVAAPTKAVSFLTDSMAREVEKSKTPTRAVDRLKTFARGIAS